MEPKQKKIWEMELKFVRGDGKVIPNISTTLGALFTLYAEDLGYTVRGVDGEWFNDRLKELLPVDKLTSFERNFIAYKLAEALAKLNTADVREKE